MERFNNTEYLKQEIIGQSRHQFVFGYNNEERHSFLQELERDFPVMLDCNIPIVINISDIGLPKLPENTELDRYKIDILSRDYLSFMIANAILLRTKARLDLDWLNYRMFKLFEVINKYNKNPKCPDINNLEALITAFEQSIKCYKKYYSQYLNGEVSTTSINELTIPFLEIESFVSLYKKAINNSSYFCIIIDKQDDITLSSTKAINSLVNSRINKDISMKVVVEPDKWDTYIDSSGQYIDAIHDYGIVELDSSNKEYTRKLKNKNGGL